jgi:hypothetical protein
LKKKRAALTTSQGPPPTSKHACICFWENKESYNLGWEDTVMRSLLLSSLHTHLLASCVRACVCVCEREFVCLSVCVYVHACGRITHKRIVGGVRGVRLEGGGAPGRLTILSISHLPKDPFSKIHLQSPQRAPKGPQKSKKKRQSSTAVKQVTALTKPEESPNSIKSKKGVL